MPTPTSNQLDRCGYASVPSPNFPVFPNSVRMPTVRNISTRSRVRKPVLTRVVNKHLAICFNLIQTGILLGLCLPYWPRRAIRQRNRMCKLHEFMFPINDEKRLTIDLALLKAVPSLILNILTFLYTTLIRSKNARYELKDWFCCRIAEPRFNFNLLSHARLWRSSADKH